MEDEMTTDTTSQPSESADEPRVDDAALPPAPPAPPVTGATQAGGAPSANPAPPAAPKTNVLAIVSLVSGFFVGLAGVVCGIIALRQVKRTREGGRGLAIAGIAVGAVQTVVSTLLTIVIVAVAAVASSAASSARSAVPDVPGLTDLPPAGTALQCAELSVKLAEGGLALQRAGFGAASDPQAALEALEAFSADLSAAAGDIGDSRVAVELREAAAEVDDFVAYLRPAVDDPAAAGPDALAGVTERVSDLSRELTDVSEACAAIR
jgi:hypothetical protein